MVRHLGRPSVRARRSEERASVRRRRIGGGLGTVAGEPDRLSRTTASIGARSEVGRRRDRRGKLGARHGCFHQPEHQDPTIARRAKSVTVVSAGSVVVAGSLPSGEGGCQLYCAVIVKQVDARTRSKTEHQRTAARLKAESAPKLPLSKRETMSVRPQILSREHRRQMRVAGRLASELLDYLTPHVVSGVTTGASTTSRTSTWSTSRARSGARSTTRRPATRPTRRRLHVGQPRRVPRHSRRQETEGRRHRQHRRHRDQGRLSRRHQPHVLRRRAVDPGQAPGRRRPTRRCGAASAPVRPGAHLGDIGAAIQKLRRGPWLLGGARVLRPRHRPQFHEEPQVLHYGRRRHRAQAAAGHDLHRRADDQRRQARHPLPRRRLDDRHRGSFAVRAMGAHGARDDR